jgi:hypothetical protein
MTTKLMLPMSMALAATFIAALTAQAPQDASSKHLTVSGCVTARASLPCRQPVALR